MTNRIVSHFQRLGSRSHGKTDHIGLSGLIGNLVCDGIIGIWTFKICRNINKENPLGAPSLQSDTCTFQTLEIRVSTTMTHSASLYMDGALSLNELAITLFHSDSKGSDGSDTSHDDAFHLSLLVNSLFLVTPL